MEEITSVYLITQDTKKNSTRALGMSFPMASMDIPKSVNIFLRISRRKGGSRRICMPFESAKGSERTLVDLLLIADDDTNHYCYIKDFGRLVESQYTKRLIVNAVYMNSAVINLLEIDHNIEERMKK